MLRRTLIVCAVLGAAMFAGSSSAEAGGCHRGGYWGGYGGHPGYYRSARPYYGYGPSYHHRRYAYRPAPAPYYRGYGGSGVYLSIGF